MKTSKLLNNATFDRKSNVIAMLCMLGGLLAVPALQAESMDMSATEADKAWLLPDAPPYPADNQPNDERIALGKQLFFDPRLSGDGNMSCASCHNPVLGWSDGLPVAKGVKSKSLARATPTVINTAYNSIQMWDGRKATLEEQAMGPIESADEMAQDTVKLFAFLQANPEYKAAFARAYPNEPIGSGTLGKAIASYERTLISNNSPFDRWLNGDDDAMTEQQIRGFRLFSDKDKGNCTACHQAPNFTDNGFHNLGLASHGAADPDLGRFKIKRLPSLRGAFKTPTLRDVALTAPYFHDGSAQTLLDVVKHYNKGGEVKQDLSQNIKPLNLSDQEMQDIVAFMEALTSEADSVVLPKLPSR